MVATSVNTCKSNLMSRNPFSAKLAIFCIFEENTISLCLGTRKGFRAIKSVRNVFCDYFTSIYIKKVLFWEFLKKWNLLDLNHQQSGNISNLKFTKNQLFCPIIRMSPLKTFTNHFSHYSKPHLHLHLNSNFFSPKISKKSKINAPPPPPPPPPTPSPPHLGTISRN